VLDVAAREGQEVHPRGHVHGYILAVPNSDVKVTAEMAQRARSFDAWATDYDRYRPTYPQALFDHVASRLALPRDAVVADVGAGTGKAARQMARRGWRVIAIEPGEGMLEIVQARAADEKLDIEARLAPAEDTGLRDASVDLVTAAQAFHWFDKPRAVAEMARIVDRSEFLAAYTDLVARYVPDEHVDKRAQTDEPSSARELAYAGYFDVDDREVIQHDVVMTRDEFVAYVFTASYVRLFVTAENQSRLRDEVSSLVDRSFPDGRAVVPYDVDVYVGKRIAGGTLRE